MRASPFFRLLASVVCLSLLGIATGDFEFQCQPPSLRGGVMHVQDVSPAMEGYINGGLRGPTGAIKQFDDLMHSTFTMDAVSGIMRFTNKRIVTGTSDDRCSSLYRPLLSRPLEPAYASMPINIGADGPERSVLDAMWRAGSFNWQSALSDGVKVVFLYTDKMYQTDAPGTDPFDFTTQCETINYPSIADLAAKYTSAGVNIVFFVPPEHFSAYELLASSVGLKSAVMPISDDPDVMMQNMYEGMNKIFCDLTCTQNAILQLLHAQDISHSYNNDLHNIWAKYPVLLNLLESNFHRREVALASFSDKPHLPVGYWLDYCYREDAVFNDDTTDFLNALNSLVIKSGLDWKESQYDALYDGVNSSSIGWNFDDLEGSRRILRVAMLATDAGPHVKGHFPSLPYNLTLPCDERDYPSAADLGAYLDDKGVYPIFVVTSDLFNYWKNKASKVSSNAKVMKLQSDPNDLFDAIMEILEEICNDRRRV